MKERERESFPEINFRVSLNSLTFFAVSFFAGKRERKKKSSTNNGEKQVATTYFGLLTFFRKNNVDWQFSGTRRTIIQ